MTTHVTSRLTSAGPLPETPQRSRVLVVSVGLSPQVVTETLHALWAGEGWLPDRLVLICTPRAAELARALLLDPERGAIATWARDWSVPWGARLVQTTELAVASSDSGDLDEDRGAVELAECTWRILSHLTADPDSEVHVSVAGGRKPAAALLGILMAVLGRPQDRLSHVLLIPDSAAAAGLYYPAPRPQPVLAGAGIAVDASELQIRLIDIPFPRLALNLSGADGLRTFFARLSHAATRTRLAFDRLSGRLTWDGTELSLPPAIGAFIAWAAVAQADGGAGLPRVGAARSGYLGAYGVMAGKAAVERARTRLPDPLDPEWMEEKVARANKLAEACGIRPRGAKLVQTTGARARAVYRLALDPAEIAVTGAAAAGMTG